MKKFYLSLVLAAYLFSGVSLADTYTETMTTINNNYFNGLYLGASMGVSYLKDDEKNVGIVKICTISPTFCWTNIEKKQIHGNKTSATTNIFLGYSKVLNQKYYLGVEIFVQHSPFSLNFSWDSKASPSAPIFKYTNKVKTNYFYGTFIKCGYLTSKRSLLYLLLGYEGSRFQLQHNIGQKLSFTYDYSIIDSKKVYKNLNGFIGGLGLETYLARRISLMVQYTHTFYRTISYKNNISMSTPTRIYSLEQQLKDNFQLGLFSIGLTYHLA